MSDQVLADLKQYLSNQIAEAERSAAAYRSQAAQCRELRGGLEQSREAAVADRELDLYLVGQIAAAAKSEFENLKLASSYDAEAGTHRARLARLGGNA